MVWDGNERREDDPQMLKLLNSMDKNLALLTQSSQAQAKAFEAHLVEDATFAKDVKGQLAFQNKIVFMGLGAIALISFITKFIK